MTVVRQHNPARISHDGAVTRASLNDAPIIDWRKSRSDAYGRPDHEVCSDLACGCLLETVPAHSPRCKA